MAELWWLPLTWAINLVYKIGQSAEKEHAIIPKDSKSVIQQLVKLKTNLDNQKERNDNKFPHFYRKVIRLKIFCYYSLKLLHTFFVRFGVEILIFLLMGCQILTVPF